jgi:tetratricopeptide (TPR) repeat protein
MTKLKKKALLAIQKGQYREAKQIFEKLLSTDEGYDFIWLEYAECLSRLGFLDRAEKWLDKVIESKKILHRRDALLEKAYIQLKREHFEEAIAILRELVNELYYNLEKIKKDDRFQPLFEMDEFHEVSEPDTEYQVNDYISLKLFGSHSVIFVCDEYYASCYKVLLTIPVEKIEVYEDIDAIDEIIEQYNKDKPPKEDIDITPEEEFWGHCSNMQAWVDNEYDMRLIADNLGFGILKKMVEVCNQKALTRLKEEIIKRLRSSSSNVLTYLLREEFIAYLTAEDIFDGLLDDKDAEIMRQISSILDEDYTITIPISESFHAREYRTEGKSHMYTEHGQVLEVELRIPSSEMDHLDKLISLVSTFSALVGLYIFLSGISKKEWEVIVEKCENKGFLLLNSSPTAMMFEKRES